jgi:hypothetical protein
MRSYENFEDSETSPAAEGVLFQQQVYSKFCFYGFVGSNSWDITFAVVIDGVVRIYDSSETYHRSPEEFVSQIVLTPQHSLSGILVKDYSKDPALNVIIHYCYILADNGLWSPTKIIKVGSPTRSGIDRFVTAVRQSIPK